MCICYRYILPVFAYLGQIATHFLSHLNSVFSPLCDKHFKTDDSLTDDSLTFSRENCI